MLNTFYIPGSWILHDEIIDSMRSGGEFEIKKQLFYSRFIADSRSAPDTEELQINNPSAQLSNTTPSKARQQIKLSGIQPS